MTEKEAFEIFRQLCAIYKGTLADHQKFAQAQGVIERKLFPKKKEPKK